MAQRGLLGVNHSRFGLVDLVAQHTTHSSCVELSVRCSPPSGTRDDRNSNPWEVVIACGDRVYSEIGYDSFGVLS
jgi:hypothetical protein